MTQDGVLPSASSIVLRVGDVTIAAGNASDGWQEGDGFDIAQAALELARAESGYKATLAAASHLNMLTLTDFLR